MKSALKVFGVIALLVISMLAFSGIAHADSVPVTIEKVYVNGVEVVDGEVTDITVDEDIEVKVKFLATGDDEHVTVEAKIDGLDRDADEAEAETDTFTVREGKTYTKTLDIRLPERADPEEEYDLEIEFSSRGTDDVVYNARIYASQERHDVKIKDVIFSPSDKIKAGYSMITNVRVKNIGERDEEGIKVTVSIPELDVSDSKWIDELEEGDTKTSEDLYFRIPQTAEEKEYTVEVTVEYDDGDKEVTAEYLYNVVSGEQTPAAAQKTKITVLATEQDLTAGGNSVVYPLTITNQGTASKTYVLNANVGDWATSEIDPNVLTVDAGETKAVYVSVAANKGTDEGEKVFGVTISSGDKALQDLTFKANVQKATNKGNLTTGLEIALIVLVVILVIIGLVIGFSRLRRSEEPSAEDQTYY